MNAWNLPGGMAPNSCASSYVEFDTTDIFTVGDDAADWQYRVEGPGDTFVIKARGTQNSWDSYSVSLQVSPDVEVNVVLYSRPAYR